MQALAVDENVHGSSLVSGSAFGELMVSDEPLSFWGGVDPTTSEVIDRNHPLSGTVLQDKILAIPSGKGSCSGSTVVLELLLNGRGPRALLFERPDVILSTGILLARDLFDTSMPAITLGGDNFDKLKRWNGQEIHVNDAMVSLKPPNPSTRSTPSMERNSCHEVMLSERDRATLNGANGELAKLALRIVLGAAKVMNAAELIDISHAHIDSAFYSGPGSLAIAEKLFSLKGAFHVPTTINAISVDMARWKSQGVDAVHGAAGVRIAEIYTALGAKPVYTCAPYLSDHVPKPRELIAWGESNAVAYANSFLGARTLKCPDGLESAIALTGRAPLASVYLSEHRKAQVWVDVSRLDLQYIDDAFWPVLGLCIGDLAANQIPVVTGLEYYKLTTADKKAFGAAFATTSSAPMFHMVGITPEATSLQETTLPGTLLQTAKLTWDALSQRYQSMNHARIDTKIDLISLGNPHFSFGEIKSLSQLVHGRKKHSDVEIIITTGRSQYGLAQQAGLIEELEYFGVQFIRDTCWCFITEPIIPERCQVIMTNSGKYGYFGPGLTGRKFAFGSLKMCVDAAVTGRTSSELPKWLQPL